MFGWGWKDEDSFMDLLTRWSVPGEVEKIKIYRDGKREYSEFFKHLGGRDGRKRTVSCYEGGKSVHI